MIRCYDFHGLVRLQIEAPLRAFQMGSLGGLYHHYIVDQVDRANLVVRVQNFCPEIMDCYVTDDQYYTQRNYLYCRRRHKTARWEVELRGLEEEITQLAIQGNWSAYWVWPNETLEQLIRFKFGQAGGVTVHGAGLCRDGKGYLLAGRSGVGKSITTFKMLEQGYRLLGDDRVVLCGDEICSLICPMGLRSTYDLERTLGLRLTPGQKRDWVSKKLLRLMTAGYFQLFTQIQPTETFPDFLVDRAEFQVVAVLVAGPSLAIERDIDKDEFVQQLLLNNQFEEAELIEYLAAYTHVFPDSKLADYWSHQAASLRQAVDRAKCLRITVPKEYTDEVFGAICAEITA
jgi:hypothetical protein